MKTKQLAFGFTVALLAAGLSGCFSLEEARRRGEVDVWKGAPSAADATTGNRPAALYLRGSGYSLTRAIGAIKGPTDEPNDAGWARTFLIADELLRNVRNDLSSLVANGSTNSNPLFDELTNMSTRLQRMREQCQTNVLFSGSEKRDAFLESLSVQKDYLLRLMADLEFLKAKITGEVLLDSSAVLPSDLLVQVFDQQLSYGEFTADEIEHIRETRERRRSFLTNSFAFRESKTFTRLLDPYLQGDKFDERFEHNGRTNDYAAEIKESFVPGQRFYVNDPYAFAKRYSNVIDRCGFLTTANWENIRNDATNRLARLAQILCDLQVNLFIVGENLFNLIEGVGSGSPRGFFMWDYHHARPKFFHWGRGLMRLTKQVESALRSTQAAQDEALKILRTDEVQDSELAKIQPEIRAFARRYADLTGRAFNKQLTKREGSDVKPLYVTLILKTFFVKNLGKPRMVRAGTSHPKEPLRSVAEPGYGNLLAVCRVKTDKNKGVHYPIIYQENFLSGSFVSVKDRVVYGPTPYLGSFMDMHFALIKAAEDTSTVRSGFKALLGTVNLINPEFAAISPGISALFNAIVNNANKDERELEIQWTIPGEEARDSSDTDGLMAETGIYVVIKTESNGREGSDVSSALKTYRSQLLYNPEDGRLYWRKTFSDPKRNFADPNNEFRDKTYAVFALVDEYQQPDNIAEVLRDDLKAVFDEKRAKSLIPDPKTYAEEVNGALETAMSVIASKVSTNEADRKKLETWIKSTQAALWQQGDDKEKQTSTKLLWRLADPATRSELGEDIDKWRKAKLKIGPDNAIQKE